MVAREHKTVRLYLEHSRVSGQSNMSYTSFAQKPHFLSRNSICCFCVERHCFSLQTICFPSPLSWTTAYLLQKKKNPVNDLVVWNKVLAFVQCDCSVFHFLFACHTNTPTEACARTSSVALWGFLTCLQFFWHIICCSQVDSNSSNHTSEACSRAHSESCTFDSFYANWCKGSFTLGPLEYGPWLVSCDVCRKSFETVGRLCNTDPWQNCTASMSNVLLLELRRGFFLRYFGCKCFLHLFCQNAPCAPSNIFKWGPFLSDNFVLITVQAFTTEVKWRHWSVRVRLAFTLVEDLWALCRTTPDFDSSFHTSVSLPDSWAKQPRARPWKTSCCFKCENTLVRQFVNEVRGRGVGLWKCSLKENMLYRAHRHGYGKWGSCKITLYGLD